MGELERSACDGAMRPHGCGFRPPPGAISHLFTLPNGAGPVGRHPMDLGAHGFGEEGHVYDAAALLRRYGPNFHGTDHTSPRFLALDFESLFGVGSIYLTQLACANAFGTAQTMSCFPTLEELHDYFACHPEEATRALNVGGGGGGQPAWPAITTISTPGPGKVEVKWQTRAGHTSFELRVGSVTATTNGEARQLVVELPLGEGGKITATVTALIGATRGRPSREASVVVQPRMEEPPGEVKLSAESRDTVAAMVTWAGKTIGPRRAERLLALKTELDGRAEVALSAESTATVAAMVTWAGKPVGPRRAERLQALRAELDSKGLL